MDKYEMAQHRISGGNEFPYDAPDSWWNGDGKTPPPPSKDWAHTAARAVVRDLTDRRGIKHGFNDIDEDVRVELVQSLADIIRLAHEQDNKRPLSETEK